MLTKLRTNKHPILSYLKKIDVDRHSSSLYPICRTESHTISHSFNCTKIKTKLTVEVVRLLAEWKGQMLPTYNIILLIITMVFEMFFRDCMRELWRDLWLSMYCIESHLLIAWCITYCMIAWLVYRVFIYLRDFWTACLCLLAWFLNNFLKLLTWLMNIKYVETNT